MKTDLYPQTTSTFWRLLIRWRVPLAVLLVCIFLVTQITTVLMLDNLLLRLLVDIASWGTLAVLTVWLGLVWAHRREARHQADLEQALQNQRELNSQLQRANEHLALLSETNQHLAGSSTLDEILDSALVFPQRLVPARAAALILTDAAGAIETRTRGYDSDRLACLRDYFGISAQLAEAQQPCLLSAPPHSSSHPNNSHDIDACLVLPLHDGLAPVGWIELYLTQTIAMTDDEQGLLETIVNEITEAIISARRRSREERAIYELERAIVEERARIARDIHDGLAQSLAFLRMRVDLWQDWIEGDPQRLHTELADLKHTLREQIRELRRAIFALRPVQFDELGFVGGLRRYIMEFADQQGWEAHIDLTDAPLSLSLELEAVCFRIVQEALNNAAKHAAASVVEVTIDQIDNGMRLMIRDNGRGFEPGYLSELAAEHVGLRHMYERLAAFRGQLTPLSRPGVGTELRVWIPLCEQHDIHHHSLAGADSTDMLVMYMPF